MINVRTKKKWLLENARMAALSSGTKEYIITWYPTANLRLICVLVVRFVMSDCQRDLCFGLTCWSNCGMSWVVCNVSLVLWLWSSEMVVGGEGEGQAGPCWWTGSDEGWMSRLGWRDWRSQVTDYGCWHLGSSTSTWEMYYVNQVKTMEVKRRRRRTWWTGGQGQWWHVLSGFVVWTSKLGCSSGGNQRQHVVSSWGLHRGKTRS